MAAKITNLVVYLISSKIRHQLCKLVVTHPPPPTPTIERPGGTVWNLKASSFLSWASGEALWNFWGGFSKLLSNEINGRVSMGLRYRAWILRQLALQIAGTNVDVVVHLAWEILALKQSKKCIQHGGNRGSTSQLVAAWSRWVFKYHTLPSWCHYAWRGYVYRFIDKIEAGMMEW